ncbi:MAG: DEAD/DEAH box helicase family protein [Candidatus Saccharimonadales bacterium]
MNDDKKKLTEAEIRTRYITPAIVGSGWQLPQVREEFFYFTSGRIVVRGKEAKRKAGKKVDYLLYYKPNLPLAVVEAKDNRHDEGDGMQQAIEYAEHLDVPFVFTSNGDSFVMHDSTGLMPDTERTLSLSDFPDPEQLYSVYKQWRGIDEDNEKLAISDYYSDNSGKEPRYYQRVAINRAIEAIARGQKRILLVMATGTGKTYTAAQIIWRYWKTNQGKQKRILFLADRNILVDQTRVNDFKHFGSAMTKITNRSIDKSYEIYLSLYQAVTGTEEASNIYKQFSPDFFDLIVIDECHRGSAKADSGWREILEYFSGAIQVGLTATPKETKSVSNIDYFGEPVYTYSLKQGIDDGFLAPYKVIRIATDVDTFGWRPDEGMLDDDGNPVEDREYTTKDFDRKLVLPERDQKVGEYITKFLKKTDPFAKTILFCVDINHASRMRKVLTNLNRERVQENSKYIMQITGDDEQGKRELDNFIDPESRYPVIATTSKLMTTGVDAQTCKVIVLDSNIESMTEFKQIIGRGTRVREDYGKMYFTILDFRNVTKLFSDPDFDGDPVKILEANSDAEFDEALEVIDDPDVVDSERTESTPNFSDDNTNFTEFPDDKPEPFRKLTISGVSVKIIGERVQYIDSNGKLITESLTDFTRRNILGEYATLNDFLNAWNSAERRSAIIEELIEKGIPLEDLREQAGYDLDIFDLILHVAYDRKPIKRRDRVEAVRRSNYLNKYQGKAREVLESLLEKYKDTGIDSVEDIDVLRVDPIRQFGAPLEIVSLFGGVQGYRSAVFELEEKIYEGVAV